MEGRIGSTCRNSRNRKRGIIGYWLARRQIKKKRVERRIIYIFE
jgi:hypothetical protein